MLIILRFYEPAISQINDTTNNDKGRLYIGLSFTTVSHHIYYKDFKGSKDITSGYFAPLALNIGYSLNEHANLQLGLAYGGSSDNITWSPGAMDTLSYNVQGNTNVLATPITLRWVFLKAYRRFPVYGMATLMPAYGISKSKTVETRNGETTNILDARDSGVNVFLTAGFGFNFRISKRFNGLAEYYALKYNLNGRNSFYYDWDQGFTGFNKIYRSIGIGVNYDLN